MLDKSVKKWSAHFRAGHESLVDDPRQGQANTFIMANLIDKVDDLERSDCLVTLRILAIKMDVSSLINRIVVLRPLVHTLNEVLFAQCRFIPFHLNTPCN